MVINVLLKAKIGVGSANFCFWSGQNEPKRANWNRQLQDVCEGFLQMIHAQLKETS